MRVQAEISLYPLRTEELSKPINTFCGSLTDAGLTVDSGPMSTRLFGESAEVFGAIQRAFEKTARDYQLILNLRLSNACPDEPRTEET